MDARPFSIENKDDRQLVVDILLHSADISNTCKPFVISKRWSDLLLEEFLSQGDLEKEFCMPISPFMDRQSTDPVRNHLSKWIIYLFITGAYDIEFHGLHGGTFMC